ncbi:protein SRC2 homolog [Vigna radiata var. radiata]|uniref:Protein SRC2 homolog n=1 Tax=Vigna radiata var. radiata TaxID=3916 RepID=A0A1S3TBM4_VIGRR|nr:protein SRC2 homolog [Vigna radiata var. radiata]
MEPDQRCIEVKLISCKDLRAFNFFQKLTVYATVFVDSEDPKREMTEERKQRQRTLTHRENDGDGTNPEWNNYARFDLGWLSRSPRHSDYDDLFLCFEFRHDGVILGDKVVGECRVAFSDLIRDAAAGTGRFVSYEVRSPEGKPNGIFNFSYKLIGFGSGIGNWNGSVSGMQSSQFLEGRISGYPVLAPEDCACASNRVQYPTCEIENTCCYPAVAMPVGFPVYPAAAPPPPVMLPSYGEYNFNYPQPPPPPPVTYPYPPQPPPAVHVYPHFGPEPHPWPQGPYSERRW